MEQFGGEARTNFITNIVITKEYKLLETNKSIQWKEMFRMYSIKKIKVGPRTKKSKIRKYFRIKKYFRKMNRYGINKSIL